MENSKKHHQNDSIDAEVIDQPKKNCKSCKNTKNNIFVLSSSALILITSVYGGYKIFQNLYQWFTH